MRRLHSGIDFSDQAVYNRNANFIKKLGDNYMGREFSSYMIDEENAKIFRFMQFYIHGDQRCEEVIPHTKVCKNILLIGDPGVGKTMIMQIFSDYSNMLNLPRKFTCVSISQLLNSSKLNGNIDKYTYNEKGSNKFEGNPISLCLNDIGLSVVNQKDYGTDMNVILEEFLYARYEIYQNTMLNCHLTSNMSVEDFESNLKPSLLDRMKSYNVIPVYGKSRR